MAERPIIQFSYNWQPETVKRKKPSLYSLLYESVKAALKLRFTGFGGSSGQSWGGLNWASGIFTNSRINYAQEAGELEKSSLVMAAVNWLGRVLPEAPLQVMRADARGKEQPIPNHAAIDLLNRPNPFFSGATLWKAFAMSWITSGNVYFLKARNSFGQVVQLWHIPPWMIAPRWPEDGSEFISYYEYQSDGAIARISVDDVIHFRDGADPANMGRTGLSPVASVLREICGDNEVAVYQFLLLKQGGVPPVAVALKDGQVSVKFEPEVVKADYVRSTTGDQRGKVFVSNRAVEITKLGFNPSELDMKVLRHLPESRFASVIGIAKETLGFGAADENSTYNNVESADERSICTYAKPLWDFIGDELTHQLRADVGLRRNHRIGFDLRQIAALQEDQNMLHDRANKDLASGGITVNEYREMIGLEARPDGEVYLRSTTIQAVTPEVQSAAIEAAINPPELSESDSQQDNGMIN
jgi:HK97 family phage portal protein